MPDTFRTPEKVFVGHLHTDRQGIQLDSRQAFFKIRQLQAAYAAGHGEPFRGIIKASNHPWLEWDVYVSKSGECYSVYRTPDRALDQEKFYSLGVGGFNKVWLGQSMDNGQWVAIKEPKSPESPEEIIKENQLLNKIGNFVDQFEQNSIIKLAYGSDLTSYVKRPNKPISEVTDICLKSAQAIRTLNEENRIIHRDLKPANIMYDPEEKKVKIIDVNLARLKASNEEVVSDSVMGTLNYIAPEIAQSRQYSDKSDVYAAGLMFAELLTKGKGLSSPGVDMSFTFLKSLEKLNQGIHPQYLEAFKDILDKNARDENLPQELVDMYDMVAKMLDANPNNRPTWAEIINTLEKTKSLTLTQEPVNPEEPKKTLSSKNNLEDDLVKLISPSLDNAAARQLLETEYAGAYTIIPTKQTGLYNLLLFNGHDVQEISFSLQGNKIIIESQTLENIARYGSSRKKMKSCDSVSEMMGYLSANYLVRYGVKVDSGNPQYHLNEYKPVQKGNVTDSAIEINEVDKHKIDEKFAPKEVVSVTDTFVLSDSVVLQDPVVMKGSEPSINTDTLSVLKTEERDKLATRFESMIDSLSRYKTKLVSSGSHQSSHFLTFGQSQLVNVDRQQREENITNFITSLEKILATRSFSNDELLMLTHQAVDFMMQEFNLSLNKPKEGSNEFVKSFFDLTDLMTREFENRQLMRPVTTAPSLRNK